MDEAFNVSFDIFDSGDYAYEEAVALIASEGTQENLFDALGEVQRNMKVKDPGSWLGQQEDYVEMKRSRTNKIAMPLSFGLLVEECPVALDLEERSEHAPETHGALEESAESLQSAYYASVRAFLEDDDAENNCQKTTFYPTLRGGVGGSRATARKREIAKRIQGLKDWIDNGEDEDDEEVKNVLGTLIQEFQNYKDSREPRRKDAVRVLGDALQKLGVGKEHVPESSSILAVQIAGVKRSTICSLVRSRLTRMRGKVRKERSLPRKKFIPGLIWLGASVAKICAQLQLLRRC